MYTPLLLPPVSVTLETPLPIWIAPLPEPSRLIALSLPRLIEACVDDISIPLDVTSSLEVDTCKLSTARSNVLPDIIK